MKSNYIYIYIFFFFFKLIIYFNDLQITFIPHFYLFSLKDLMLQKLHSNGIYYNRQSKSENTINCLKFHGYGIEKFHTKKKNQ